jgi:hypothetical protein
VKALDVLHHISPIANISFLLNLDFCNLILKSFKVYLALILNIESASSSFPRRRTVPRAIMGGGGGGGGGIYSYIRVLPDGFLLKVIVFTVCEHEHMNIHHANNRV